LLVNFETLIFQLSVGLSLTAVILVGNAIGSGDHELAKRCARICFITTTAFLAVMFVVIYSLRYRIAEAYTSDQETIDLFVGAFKAMMVMWFADGLQNQLCGDCKGLGMQVEASIATIISALLGSVPLAYLLGIVLDLKLSGIWLGVCLGLTSQFFIYIYILLVRADWKTIAEQVQSQFKDYISGMSSPRSGRGNF
jgi:MATE family multidrug resistance protein